MSETRLKRADVQYKGDVGIIRIIASAASRYQPVDWERAFPVSDSLAL